VASDRETPLAIGSKKVGGGGEEGPREFGKPKVVVTSVVTPKGEEINVTGHLLGRHVGQILFGDRLATAIRRVLDGYPETAKPEIRLFDNAYSIIKEISYSIVDMLRNADSTLDGLNVPEWLRKVGREKVNILLAGYIKMRVPVYPIGIGYGKVIRDGDYVPTVSLVYVIVDKYDNLVLSCFHYEYYKLYNDYSMPCWFEPVGFYPWNEIILI